MSDEKIGAAANYGGTISDARGRPAAEKEVGNIVAGGTAGDHQATVSEQLDRILPKEG